MVKLIKARRKAGEDPERTSARNELARKLKETKSALAEERIARYRAEQVTWTCFVLPVVRPPACARYILCICGLKSYWGCICVPACGSVVRLQLASLAIS